MAAAKPFVTILREYLVAAFQTVRVENGYHRDYGDVISGTYGIESEKSSTHPKIMILRAPADLEGEGVRERGGDRFRRFEDFNVGVHVLGDRNVSCADAVDMVEADFHHCIIQNRAFVDASGNALPGNPHAEDAASKIAWHPGNEQIVTRATVVLIARVRYDHLTGDMGSG